MPEKMDEVTESELDDVDVGDDDAAKGSGTVGLGGAAVAAVEAEVEGGIVDVAHGVAGDGDVFDEGAVGGLECDAFAAVDDIAGNGDVAEAAVGFGAALDAALARDGRDLRGTSSRCRR